MRKCVGIFAATAAMLIQFAEDDVTALETLGAKVHAICQPFQVTVTEFAMEAFRKRHPGVIWHTLPFADTLPAARQNRKALEQLMTLLQEIQPDLLHCHGTTAGKYGRMAAKALEIPVFYTAHDFRLYHGCFWVERLWFSGMEKKYSACTNVMFTVCPEDTAYAQKKLSAGEVAELPYTSCIDSTYYAAPKRDAASVRREWQIPEDAILLLSVGGLRAQKRFRIVIQAMARLRDLDRLHYVICGEGDDRIFLEKLIEKLHLTDRVHLVGYRTDIPDILGAADIFCMPSRREGCGISSLEAMAAGLPLLMTRVHGTKAFDAMEDGVIFLKGDLVASCADGIRRLAENKLLRKQMSAHNRAAGAKFSDEERMMVMRTYYQKILD